MPGISSFLLERCSSDGILTTKMPAFSSKQQYITLQNIVEMGSASHCLWLFSGNLTHLPGPFLNVHLKRTLVIMYISTPVSVKHLKVTPVFEDRLQQLSQALFQTVISFSRFTACFLAILS